MGLGGSHTRRTRRTRAALIAAFTAFAAANAAVPAVAHTVPATPAAVVVDPAHRPGCRAHSGSTAVSTVTNFSDNLANPAPGTLRFFVERAACAGSVVTFQSPTVVNLAGPLNVVLPLTITGGAIAGGGALNISASDTTLSHMSISNTRINVGPETEFAGPGLQHVSVIANEIHDNDRTLGYALFAVQVSDLKIGGSGDAGNTFQTLTPTAVELQFNGKADVIGNTFDVGPGNQHNIAIDEHDSSNLTVQDNTSDGDFLSEPGLARFVHNTIDESGAAASSTRQAHESRPGPPHKITPLQKLFGSGLGLLVDGLAYSRGGHVLVEGNTITNAGILGNREDIDIVNNRVTLGAYGIQETCGSKDIENRGSIFIAHNTVRQALTGIRYVCVIRTPSATIADNHLLTNDARGMELTTRRAIVLRNQVLDSGAAGSPRGLPAPGIQVDAPGGDVSLTSNITDANTGDGVLFKQQTVAYMVNGETHQNGRAGAFVEPKARVRLSRGSYFDNRGPGIDLDPRGVTPNGALKNGNHSHDWPQPLVWDKQRQRIAGHTCPRCLVEGFAREPPPWTGNPSNGEGQTFVADVIADARGRFIWPSVVPTCEDAKRYTFTSTSPGRIGHGVLARASARQHGITSMRQITSEFSPPPDCPGGVPSTGTGTMPTQPTGPGTTTQPAPGTTTTNPTDGAHCATSDQTCSGNNATCDGGSRCTGPGSVCGPGSTCTGTSSSCAGSGTTCSGTNSQCTASGGMCTGQNDTCTAGGSRCTGPGDTCTAGSTCSGTPDSCTGGGTTCTAPSGMCSAGSTCSGPSSACTGTGTLCTAGDVSSTCTMGAYCTKPPPSASLPPCPGPAGSVGLVLDTFIPSGTTSTTFKVFELDGTTPLPSELCTNPGFATTVTGQDHPEITGTDPIDGSTIPPGRHVYRVTITITNSGSDPGGEPTVTPGATGQAFRETGWDAGTASQPCQLGQQRRSVLLAEGRPDPADRKEPPFVARATAQHLLQGGVASHRVGGPSGGADHPPRLQSLERSVVDRGLR
jgi:hypothetical protein